MVRPKTWVNDTFICPKCESMNIVRNGTIRRSAKCDDGVRENVRVQGLNCRSCNYYAAEYLFLKADNVSV